MKYKVWGKAGAILKQDKQHYINLATLLFALAFLATVAIAVRLSMLYADSIYSGIREPYIQLLSSDSVAIRWQSENLVRARVVIAEAVDSSDMVLDEKVAKFAHELRFKQLKPATRYYYKIYHDQKMFRSGDEYWFETAPVTGADDAVRIWLLGDPGTAGKGLQAVKQTMTDWVRQHPRQAQSKLNMIISSGDNGDESGSNQGYQSRLFSLHQDLLKNIVFWPVYSEHDASGWSFFNIFSLPKQAESGGVASATERYYSVDYGALHLIFLDSNEGGYSADDEMINWLKQDLKNTRQKWLMAFMHHPPYSRGSHNSNDPKDSANRMFNMRKRIIPVLEQASVDLVISGHSHSYERSYLVDCHYGVSSVFKAESILQRGPKFYKAHIKKPHQGSVYTVLGSSAETEKGPFDHPVMAVSEARLGSMIIDIENDKLIARFIDDKAQVMDQFEINKVADNLLPASAKTQCQKQII